MANDLYDASKVVRLPAFYFDDSSSNPADVYSFVQ